jgi:hypothetical protein
MWTTFSKREGAITGKGYTKGFVECNARATNKHRHRTAVAYLVNRFINPFIKNFFITNNIPVNEELFALSELIQWIWRSAIREGKPIQAYIPSSRMREILKDWVDGKYDNLNLIGEN